MNELKPHPLAEIFPLLDESGLNAMADDIRKNGLHQAIIIHDGKVLDGRNGSPRARSPASCPGLKNSRGMIR
jgi:hypothetical protein